MRVGAFAGLASVVVALAGCTADDGKSQFDDAAQSHAGVDEITAQASAAAPMARPGVSVAFEISIPEAVTVVVTKKRPLDPFDYAPADLVVLGSIPGGGNQSLREVAAGAMVTMYEAALAADAPFRISTAYRPYGFQQSLYAGYVAQLGTAAADRVSARPGFSEHQTGLAADVYDVQKNHLKRSFGTSDAGQWLVANAYAYGYIVSYPDGKEDVTGYKWEPWHIRFVGVDVATSMHDQGIVTLQEFMGVEASPGYE